MAAELGEKEAGEQKNCEKEHAHEDDDGEDDHETEKRGKHSKKHKHKHSKKHKRKHKKRKHKKRSPSRSRSKSSSRSRSRSPDSNGENSEEDTKTNVADLRVASSEENGRVKQESALETTGLDETEDLPFGWFPEADDSAFEEIARRESEDVSFKLTKSPPSSVSPSAAPASETEVVRAEAKASDASKIENKVNLGFPLKISSFLESKSKSPDNSEQAIQSKRARSPADVKIKSRSRSPSSPPESKIKKRSRSNSRSRSRSRTNTQLRKSRSKSPRKHSKKKSRSSISSRSRSRSKSRSRSRNKHRSLTRSMSRSRSPQKHKQRDRSRSRSSSYSRKKSRKRERSQSRSRKSRSGSPRKKSRGSYDSKTRGRSRSPSYRDRKSKRDNSHNRKGDYPIRYRRSRSRENRYSRRSRSATPTRSHRRRSCSRSPRRGHARSPRRGRSRSPRRGRSRSPRRDNYRYRSRSRSRSRSGRYRRRSRSRSYSPRRRRSRSHSRSKSRDRQRRRSRSKSKEKNNSEENKGGEKSEANTVIPSTNLTKPTAQDLVGKVPTVSDPSNKRSLAELTEFCKKLTEARGIANEGNGTENQKEEEEDDESVEISHPFLVAPKKDITIPPVILPPLKLLPQLPLVNSNKPLTEQFPVSCGTKHHEKEDEATNVDQRIPDVNGSAQLTQQVFIPPQSQEKLDISGLVVKRMEAQRRLQADPNDLDAMLSLQEVEMKLNNWCQSNVKPGQFTGQLAKAMMPKEKMNSGYQAWAKKDMFHNLNPISGGIGMKLLQKMGWEPGQVLGKRGQGMVEPIALTVKVDRKGLSSNTEKPVGKKGGGNKPIIDLQGKHPISSLQEYCARRKWQVPEFTLIFDEGPPHSKQFLFKVAVNGYEYQHPVVSSNKKHAKAQAAVAALKGLGLVPEDADY